MFEELTLVFAPREMASKLVPQYVHAWQCYKILNSQTLASNIARSSDISESHRVVLVISIINYAFLVCHTVFNSLTFKLSSGNGNARKLFFSPLCNLGFTSIPGGKVLSKASIIINSMIKAPGEQPWLGWISGSLMGGCHTFALLFPPFC